METTESSLFVDPNLHISIKTYLSDSDDSEISAPKSSPHINDKKEVHTFGQLTLEILRDAIYELDTIVRTLKIQVGDLENRLKWIELSDRLEEPRYPLYPPRLVRQTAYTREKNYDHEL
jgi:hypothetical protein